MSRVIAVAACGLTLTACTSWMPSFDLPSMGGSSTAPAAASLAVESDPPGAQASTQGGTSCVTPCRLAVTASGPFTVNIALNGYVPQSVPVRIMQPDDPRLGSENSDGGAHLDPNPVYVELERAPPAAPPAHNKKKAAPKRPATAALRSPADTQPTASVPSSTVGTSSTAPQAPQAPPPAPANTSAAPWPMPR
jgi:hypothetical protein